MLKPLSRTQEGLKLVFSDYPICLKENKVGTFEQASKAVGVTSACLSQGAKNISRKRNTPVCPVCKRIIK